MITAIEKERINPVFMGLTGGLGGVISAIVGNAVIDMIAEDFPKHWTLDEILANSHWYEWEEFQESTYSKEKIAGPPICSECNSIMHAWTKRFVKDPRKYLLWVCPNFCNIKTSIDSDRKRTSP